MAVKELFVTLQHPRKDDGETLFCYLPCGTAARLLLSWQHRATVLRLGSTLK